VDKCIRHGWRYLGLKPMEILMCTYREFTMICEENIEKTHDQNERAAMIAIMNAAASRGKGKKGKLPKLEELYQRPTSVHEEGSKTVEDIRAEQKHTSEWLSQFDLTKLERRTTN